jgi:acetyl-CoA C-acetyltransferase
VPRDRWLFLSATAESQAMVPLPARVDLHRSFGTALAGRAVLGALDIEIDEVAHRDIYSCFPAAVQVQARELGIDPDRDDRPLTVTGGMTFGGGPLNSYVLHSTATMADRLRRDPGTLGLVTSVSGMLTKPAAAIWSTEPGPAPFAPIDVTAAARATIATLPVDPAATGRGRIVGHTVVHDRGLPVRSVAIVELDGGVRTIAVDADPERAAATVGDDRVDERVTVTTAGVFR